MHVVRRKGIQIVTWNVGRMSSADLPVALGKLREIYGRDFVLLLQEVGEWPPDLSVDGWELRHEPGKIVAALVPISMASNLRACNRLEEQMFALHMLSRPHF